MDIPNLKYKTTYSYAIMPLFKGGFWNATGIFLLMLLTNIYRSFVDEGSVALLMSVITLYIIQRLTSNQQPGQFQQKANGWLADSVKKCSPFFRPIWVKIVRLIVVNSNSRFNLTPPPSWQNRYEV